MGMKTVHKNNIRHAATINRILFERGKVPRTGLGRAELVEIILKETGWAAPSCKAAGWSTIRSYGKDVLKLPMDVSAKQRRLNNKNAKTQGAVVGRQGRTSFSEFNAFYLSKAWRVLRMKAIKKYGRVCMCCGASDQPIHVDHIKPRFKHPELELELSNLQILCEDCNMGKGGWDETDWREPESVDATSQALDAEYRDVIGRLQ